MYFGNLDMALCSELYLASGVSQEITYVGHNFAEG